MDRFYREERVPFVKDFLGRHPRCQVVWDAGCTVDATDVHEITPRGRGGNLVPVDGDESNFLATCRSCHSRLTDNDAEAKERGLLR